MNAIFKNDLKIIIDKGNYEGKFRYSLLLLSTADTAAINFNPDSLRVAYQYATEAKKANVYRGYGATVLELIKTVYPDFYYSQSKN